MKEHVIPPTYTTAGERTQAAFDWEVIRDVAMRMANVSEELGDECFSSGELVEAQHHYRDAKLALGRCLKYDRYAKAVRATPIATPETDR